MKRQNPTFFLSTIFIISIIVLAPQVLSQQRKQPPTSNEPQRRGEDSSVINNDLSVKQIGQFRFGVAIDCGSTGSRAYIYRWPNALNSHELINHIRRLRDPTTGQPVSKRIQPGLSSVASNPEGASEYARPLLQWALDWVPSESLSTTQVLLMATGGLRMVDEQIRERILSNLRRNLRAEFPQFANIGAQLITGQQEAAYLWLSANSLADRLGPKYDSRVPRKRNNWWLQSSRRLGVLEMGGASSQVAFELSPEVELQLRARLRKFGPDAVEALEKARYEVQLGPSRSVKLFAVSFLGLGSEAGRELAIELLVRHRLGLRTGETRYFGMAPVVYYPGMTLLLEDPCLPVGAEQHVERPLELLYSQEQSIGFGEPVAPDRKFTVHLVGRPHVGLCRSLTNRVMAVARKERLNCDTKPKTNNQNSNNNNNSSCSMTLLGTHFVPYHLFQFVGVGELFYTSRELLHSDGQFNFIKIGVALHRICATPLEQLNQHFPEANRVDSHRTLLECFKANWMLSWLTSGTGAPFHPPLDLKTVDSWEGEPLDWTLGAMIAQTAV